MTINGGDAGGAFDSALQHQHGIDLSGPSGVEIDNVNITNVPGDCFYVGQGWYTKRWSSDVHVHDSGCARSRRMGVAVTAGHTVLVERTSFAQIGMTAFDIEPNGAGFGATGIGSRTTRFAASRCSTCSATVQVDSVTVDNNTILGRDPMAVIAQPGQRHTNITITGNTNDTAYSNAGSVAIDVIRVNGLTVTKNIIPLGAQNMALIDVSESCEHQRLRQQLSRRGGRGEDSCLQRHLPRPAPCRDYPHDHPPTGSTAGPTGSKASAAAKATAAMQLVGTAAKTTRAPGSRHQPSRR